MSKVVYEHMLIPYLRAILPIGLRSSLTSTVYCLNDTEASRWDRRWWHVSPQIQRLGSNCRKMGAPVSIESSVGAYRSQGPVNRRIGGSCSIPAQKLKPRKVRGRSCVMRDAHHITGASIAIDRPLLCVQCPPSPSLTVSPPSVWHTISQVSLILERHRL